MSSIEVHETNIAGVWRLSSTGCRLTPAVDTIQDTGLTRRRWPFLQPVWWSIHPAGVITFAPETLDCHSLRQICDEKTVYELNGNELFQKVLNALDALRDHLFSLIVELLIPDLIFVSPESSAECMHLSLVTLPFPDLALQSDPEMTPKSVLNLKPESNESINGPVEDQIESRMSNALPDWFAVTFSWNDETIAVNREAWQSRLRDINVLQTRSPNKEKQACQLSHNDGKQMGSPDDDQKNHRRNARNRNHGQQKSILSFLCQHFRPQKHDQQDGSNTRDQSSQSHLHKTDLRKDHRYKETGIMGSFLRRIFGYTDELFEEESTEDLDLSSNALRIASLSEGLPGTPDEEHGRHAYILTDSFLIGRDIRKADFALDELGVSRIHARITRSNGHFFIEDMGSRNGTTVDGIKLKKHTVQLLPEMCRIAFGDTVFYFRSD